MKQLPPIIPTEPEQLQRAIMVLGHRAQNVSASKKLRKTLVELLGVCPESIEQAMRFKRALKQLAKWEAEDQESEVEETEESLAREEHAENQAAASFSPQVIRALKNRAKLLARLQAEQE